MTRNELSIAHNRDAIAPARPSGLGVVMILTAAVLLMNLRPIAYGATTAGDPAAVVKSTVGQVLSVLQNKQMAQDSRQRKVIEIVADRFDFADMARSSLGYNWKKLSPAQQQQFVPLFTAFMEDAYLNKIDSYSGQQVQFLGQAATADDSTEVKTVVQPAESSDPPIRINYMLKQNGGDWKVYDVTVDDISITANYRNQFNRMIEQQGFDGLMSAMREKQQELRQSIGA
jgi:phospholipid transport system substrate-binding protein